MTESVEVSAPGWPQPPRGRIGFARGEMLTVKCDRCHHPQIPWELQIFGDKSICSTCYEATIELAHGAIRAMGDGESQRLCRNCRALRDPSLGSAWCRLTELGDERARICANFVHQSLQASSSDLTGGRTNVLDTWRMVSEELQSSLGSDEYHMWFSQVEPVEIHESELVLAVPDEYTRDWLEGRMSPTMRSALAVAGFPKLVPTYVVEPPDGATLPESPSAARAHFNPHYTFDEFIVGSGNRLAQASALACVDQPGQAYNPLVIYGGVGVGKTHLLQAIGQRAIDRGHRNVLYTTSEAFTNELISAIRDGSTGAFRQRYRCVEFFLLDDIQFIAGKEATQEEFFHTFNALHQSGKQIVVTSDRPPGELRTLEDRLRSRFAWGLAVDMLPPDLETRIAIARSKAALRGRRVPDTVLNTVAVRASSNVRELEGALNRLFALADMLGTEPGMEVARTVLGFAEGGAPRAAEVLQAVAAYFRVKTSELAGPQRERRIAYARQIAMYLLREEAMLSLVEVGNQLGGRNHSTVIYSCEKIAESKSRGRVKQDLQAIRQLLYST